MGGFSLIELLVVVAVILLLARILMPALERSKEIAYGVQCASNLHQIGVACNVFAADNKGQLPGNWLDNANPNPFYRNWLCNTYNASGCEPTTTPMDGVLFPYLSNNKKILLCPKRVINYGAGTEATSNGYNDYSILLAFSGAFTSKIRAESTHTCNGVTVKTPTPLIVEESGAVYLNSSNREGGHGNNDQVTHLHIGKGYYGAVDGSVHPFKQDTTCNLHSWSSVSPKGVSVDLGTNGGWGWWNTQ